MKGVSEVIAIILILMITISLAGLAYMFMSTTMSGVTASAGSTVDSTTSSMMTSFKIESADANYIYVRNTGQKPISNLNIYINDMQTSSVLGPIATGSVFSIALGQVAMKGDAVKVTSSDGFSASKVLSADCYGAVGYWKMDENGGLYAFDSSPNGNTGNLTNMNTFGNSTSGWTNSKYGGGLLFDGENDKVVLGDNDFDGMAQLTISGWMNIISEADWEFVFGKANYDGWGPYFMQFSNNPTPERKVSFYISNLTTRVVISSNGGIPMNTWTHFACVYNGTTVVMYINGTKQTSIQYLTGSVNNTSHNFAIGSPSNNAGFFNGILDDIAIWNRSLSSYEILSLYNKEAY